MEDITPYIDEGLSWIFDGVSRLKLDINKCCEGYQAWEIILVTSATVFLCQWLHNFMFDHDKPAVLRMKEGFFYYVKRLPILSGIIKQKMDAVLEDVSAKKLFKLKPGMTYMTHLPREGKDHQQVMKVVDNYLSLDSVRWSDGLVSGTGMVVVHNSLTSSQVCTISLHGPTLSIPMCFHQQGRWKPKSCV